MLHHLFHVLLCWAGRFWAPHSSSFQAWAAPTLCEVESLWRRAVTGSRVLSGL